MERLLHEMGDSLLEGDEDEDDEADTEREIVAEEEAGAKSTEGLESGAMKLEHTEECSIAGDVEGAIATLSPLLPFFLDQLTIHSL